MVNARGNSSVLLVESLDMKMTLKKRIASTLAAGVIAISAMLAAPVAANATGNPSKLDQGDLTIACRIKEPTNQYGWKAEHLYSGVYGWRCVYLGNNSTAKSIDINNYCMSYYGSWATPSPGYWKCQGY